MDVRAEINELIDLAREESAKVGLSTEEYVAVALLALDWTLQEAIGAEGATMIFLLGTSARESLIAELATPSDPFYGWLYAEAAASVALDKGDEGTQSIGPVEVGEVIERDDD